MTSFLIIFTDLDGTILDSETYSYQNAIPVLNTLKDNQIPVIPVTSKTRLEVETLRQSLQINDPFIVENGSGIFVPLDYHHLTLPKSNQCGGYYLHRLGCTYAEARLGLKKIATVINEALQGFGDMSEAEICHLTGLSSDEAKQAKAREFTEPFVTPKKVTSERLNEIVQDLGYRIVVGDRFCHLIGAGAGKGKAVQWLVDSYQSAQPDAKITTLGLGNSPNDLEMLEAVDSPVIVPGNKGIHPGLSGKGWQVAPAPGSQGWAEAVRGVVLGDQGKMGKMRESV
ncbi:HAD-IIB family hydrolase [Coleofasciculus sp. E1-EBD-02]|uniref:HAD-IIB family hydrolase n=1 Tax=Coleofasciculus sp. E1-EBD-02 TaxID=3068481 RepID=UPI0033000476